MNFRLGLFDSGIGGFTVLRRIVERHGDISCVYLGDLARLPYGSKSPSEIRTIAKEVVAWLNLQDLSAVLIACNTTNSLALDILERELEVPVFGLIDSAVSMIKEKRLGILSTSATAVSKAYSRKILDVKPDTFVLEQACPSFVEFIERGQLDNEEIRIIAFEYLKPLLKAKVEAIILGCSHYPLLYPLLKELLPSNVRIIDPALGLAKNLDKLIDNSNQSFGDLLTFSNTRFYVTADSIGFAGKAMYWLKNYPEVELISLRSKLCVF